MSAKAEEVIAAILTRGENDTASDLVSKHLAPLYEQGKWTAESLDAALRKLEATVGEEAAEEPS